MIANYQNDDQIVAEEEFQQRLENMVIGNEKDEDLADVSESDEEIEEID